MLSRRVTHKAQSLGQRVQVRRSKVKNQGVCDKLFSSVRNKKELKAQEEYTCQCKEVWSTVSQSHREANPMSW